MEATAALIWSQDCAAPRRGSAGIATDEQQREALDISSSIVRCTGGVVQR